MAPLAGAWRATTDRTSDRTCCHNKVTQKTQWNMPLDFHPDIIHGGQKTTATGRLAGPVAPAADPVFANVHVAKGKMNLWEQMIAAETDPKLERKFSDPVFADRGAGHHHVLVDRADAMPSGMHGQHGGFHDDVLDNLGLGHHTQQGHNQGLGVSSSQRDLVYMQRIASWEDHHLVKAEEEYTTAHRPIQHGKLAVRPDKPFVAG